MPLFAGAQAVTKAFFGSMAVRHVYQGVNLVADFTGGPATTAAVAFDAWAVGINETAPAYDVLSLCTFEGAKSAVQVEFIQPGGGHGTWAVNGSNDFVFTAGSTPSTQSPTPAGSIHDPAASPSDSCAAQYRINDGNGWSEYKNLYIEVINVPAGTKYIVENQAGADDVALINNAIIAARDAGGGVVTTNRNARFWPTFWYDEAAAEWVEIAPDALDSLYFLLNRTTVSDSVIVWYPLVHLHRLPVRVVVPVYLGGNACSGSSYTPASFPAYWTRWFSTLNGPNWNTDAANAVRHNFSMISFNGNGRLRPIWNTSGPDSGTPTECGSLFGTHRSQQGDIYQFQQSPATWFEGPTSGDRRARIKYHRTYLHHHASADGFAVYERTDTEAINIYSYACGRGGFVVNEGLSKQRIYGWKDSAGVYPNDDLGGGLDIEAFSASGGNTFVDFEAKNVTTNAEIDIKAHSGSVVVLDGVKQLTANHYYWMAHGSSVTVRNFELGYYRRGNPWPHRGIEIYDNSVLTFEDGTWYASGLPFWENLPVFTPTAGEFVMALETTHLQQVIYRRCAWSSRNLPAGSNTLRCLKHLGQSTANLTLTLDDITIPAGFAQNAFILNGGTVRYRNVSHQGFPGANINTIATGASSYVAL